MTIRCTWHARDNNRVNAATTARSTQDSRGLLTWRRNTATSWRSTRISAFVEYALRASSPSQARTCQKIRYSSRSATADDPARQPQSSDAPSHRRGRPVRHPHRPSRADRASQSVGIGLGRRGYPLERPEIVHIAAAMSRPLRAARCGLRPAWTSLPRRDQSPGRGTASVGAC